MARHTYTDGIEFVLPDDCEFTRQEQQDGTITCNISYEPYTTGDAKKKYRHMYVINQATLSDDPADEQRPAEQLLDQQVQTTNKAPLTRSHKIADNPYTAMYCNCQAFTFLGVTGYMVKLMVYFLTDDRKLTSIGTALMLSDVSPRFLEECQAILEIARCVRVHGKPLSLREITADSVANIIAPFTSGESPTPEAAETPCRSTPTTSNDLFQAVTPAANLYGYYQSRSEVPGFRTSGDFLFQGVDCEFHLFSAIQTAWKDDSLRRLKIPAVRRILKKDVVPSSLAAKANEMANVFHVDSNSFNPRDDKEQEIANHYLRNICMFSGLRSFAWTLAAYCQKNETEPEEVPLDTLENLVDFIAGRKWLNYEAGSYCSGLCSGSDLHTFYLPDSASAADREQMTLSEEDIEYIMEVTGEEPSEDEISCELLSLDALRKDLAYIGPAVYRLYENLQQTRDQTVALTGNAADIVYAWCVLVLAAQEPFFTDVGPDKYHFEQKKP